AGDSLGPPTGAGRLAGEAVAGDGRDHDVKGVGRRSAMGRRIRQRLYELQLLDDGAGPAVGDDDRQGVLVLRTNVNEVDVESVDLGDEVRERIEPRLDLAPVVFCRPVAREFLDGFQRDALREV